MDALSEPLLSALSDLEDPRAMDKALREMLGITEKRFLSPAIALIETDPARCTVDGQLYIDGENVTAMADEITGTPPGPNVIAEDVYRQAYRAKNKTLARNFLEENAFPSPRLAEFYAQFDYRAWWEFPVVTARGMAGKFSFMVKSDREPDEREMEELSHELRPMRALWLLRRHLRRLHESVDSAVKTNSAQALDALAHVAIGTAHLALRLPRQQRRAIEELHRLHRVAAAAAEPATIRRSLPGATLAGRPRASAGAIRILLADGDAISREAVSATLGSTCLDGKPLELVAQADSGEEAIRRAEELRPDVLVLDVAIQGPAGLEVIRRVRESQPAIKILVFTASEGDGLIEHCTHAGAHGYVLKMSGAAALPAALARLLAGRTYFGPGVLEKIGSRLGQPRLAPRELEVLRGAAAGRSNKELAADLGVAVCTIETYLNRIFTKVGVRTRIEAVARAREQDLLN